MHLHDGRGIGATSSITVGTPASGTSGSGMSRAANNTKKLFLVSSGYTELNGDGVKKPD